MPHEPDMIAAVLGAGSALLALFAMARVACIDVRRLEIDPDWTAFAGWSALAAIIAVEGVAAYAYAVLLAAILAGSAWLLQRRWPGGIGKGDIGVAALACVATGWERFPLAAGLLLAFCGTSCIAYGIARGKRLGRCIRHRYPMALPWMAAPGAVFAWRVAEALWPNVVPAGSWGVAAVALVGSAAMAVGLLAGAYPMHARRRAAVAQSSGSRCRVHQRKET